VASPDPLCFNFSIKNSPNPAYTQLLIPWLFRARCINTHDAAALDAAGPCRPHSARRAQLASFARHRKAADNASIAPVRLVLKAAPP
jgi:hypothetical protein